MSDYEALTLQGVLQEICLIKKYGRVFKDIIVDGKYINMRLGAVWKGMNIKAGDRIEVVYKEVTDEEGKPVLVGISVRPLGDEQEVVDVDAKRPPKGFIRVCAYNGSDVLVGCSQIRVVGTYHDSIKGDLRFIAFGEEENSIILTELSLEEIENLIREAQA